MVDRFGNWQNLFREKGLETFPFSSNLGINYLDGKIRSFEWHLPASGKKPLRFGFQCLIGIHFSIIRLLWQATKSNGIKLISVTPLRAFSSGYSGCWPCRSLSSWLVFPWQSIGSAMGENRLQKPVWCCIEAKTTRMFDHTPEDTSIFFNFPKKDHTTTISRILQGSDVGLNGMNLSETTSACKSNLPLEIFKHLAPQFFGGGGLPQLGKISKEAGSKTLLGNDFTRTYLSKQKSKRRSYFHSVFPEEIEKIFPWAGHLESELAELGHTDYRGW